MKNGRRVISLLVVGSMVSTMALTGCGSSADAQQSTAEAGSGYG